MLVTLGEVSQGMRSTARSNVWPKRRESWTPAEASTLGEAVPKGTPFFKKKLGKEPGPTVIQSFRSMVEVRKHTAESWRKKGPTSDLWGSGGVPLTADTAPCRLS